MYDALTTARPYRPALSREAALVEIEKCRGWWSEAVYAAFEQTVDGLTSSAGAARAGAAAPSTP
jgi:HD-GYP domain-containing protein (c-di-GMP phosphodiesterase class II)